MSPGPKLVFFLMTLFFAATAYASPDPAPRYHLDLQFNTTIAALQAKATLELNPGRSTQLDLRGMTITAISMERQDGSQQPLAVPNDFLHITAPETASQLHIWYQKITGNDTDNLIHSDGIVLLQNWFPRLAGPATFSLAARLPPGFTALAESDSFPLTVKDGIVTSRFSQPSETLHFIAGPYRHHQLQVRPGLTVHTLFFTEEQELSARYLEKAADYLRRFEEKIGPYPYAHYVIAANRRPTGLGIPTFTLLGQSVVRLPFILDTSLGHEILHSWLGNAVSVDYQSGNWCEGLTSYLADHAFREERGEGSAYRKETILNYVSYIHPGTVLPLASFLSTEPHDIRGKAERAVGYGRGALLFHELHELIGESAFMAAVRRLSQEYRGKRVSWQDLQQVFSTTAGLDLALFFEHRLQRTDIPSLHLSGLQVLAEGQGYRIQAGLEQKNAAPYQLKIPLRLMYQQGYEDFAITLDSLSSNIDLSVQKRPLSLTLDPEYSLLRELTANEIPPLWSAFLGATKKIAVLPSPESAAFYQPLLDILSNAGWQIITVAAVHTSDITGASVLFLGIDHPLSRALFATPAHPKSGFTLDVRHHPLTAGEVVVLVSSSSTQETAAAARRLLHYGGYSYLHFTSGRLQEKRTRPSADGIHFSLEELPAGSPVSALQGFRELARQIASHQVIYLGEQHTSASDHQLQLQLLTAIHQLKPQLALAMEMFPRSRQPVLDRYFLDRTIADESDFLRQSGYFSVWGYDFRYYREIFAYARQHRLPVLGINIDKAISQRVFRDGGTDSLSAEEKASLPIDRDLDIPGYQDHLRTIHQQHHGGQASGSTAGFVQAQVLWDESMAEHIAQYLQKNPNTTIVVLAGNEHTRKDHGIPPRLARRMPVSQATVINATSHSDPEKLAASVDYYFMAPPLFLPPAGKMGVILEEQQEEGNTFLTVADWMADSHAETAGLQRGDRLLAIENIYVKNLADLRMAMIDMQQGQQVHLRIQRAGQQQPQTLILQLIAAPPEHGR